MAFANLITVRRRLRSPFIRYTAAVLAVAATLWLRVLLKPVIGQQSPYVSFFLTIVWSSWFGGFGPGVLATTLAAAGEWYYIVAPGGVGIPQQVAIVLFIGQGVLISYLVDALRKSRRRISSIVESISDGFAVFDRQWRIIYVNENAAAMTGLSPADLIGKSVWDFFPRDEGTLFWQNIRQATSEGRPAHFELYSEERQRWFEQNAYPSPEGVTLFIRDITDKKKATSELHAAKAEIEQMNEELEMRVHERTAQLHSTIKELEAFSYSVSHDLRAPLRAIDGFSKLLFEDYHLQLNPEGRRILDVIRNSTVKMGHLIDGLLAFSRLGRQAMGSSEMDMAELAHDAFSEANVGEGGRTVDLKIEDLPRAIGDRVLIRQVLINLFSNALKFTRERNPAIIEVGWKPEGDQNVFYVKDNGVGFDMRYVGKLFGVFQRLHSVDEFEGTGLGLAIVQRIIHRHGGRVWAEGAVGEGATVFFALSKVSMAQPTNRDGMIPSHSSS